MTEHDDCCETELAELERLREATWKGHSSVSRMGECAFLDLLLRIHEAMMKLHELKGKSGPAEAGSYEMGGERG